MVEVVLMKHKNEWNNEDEDWLFELIKPLTTDEVFSLIKSNRFPRELRKRLRIRLSFKFLEEVIPTIAMIGCASVVMAFVNNDIKNGVFKNETKKKNNTRRTKKIRKKKI